MKKTLLILAIATTFVSCKKQSNTPSQSTQSSTSTTTTTPTPTTTVNDTVGKTKLFFAVNLEPYTTSITDYKQDTSNFRVYLNGTKITNFNMTIDVNGNLLRYANFDTFAPNSTKAIWLATGDSLVVEFDHLEYSIDPSHGFNTSHHSNLNVYSALQPTLQYVVGWNNHVINDPSITFTDGANDPYLGTGTDVYGVTFSWNLGRKYRLVYKQL